MTKTSQHLIDKSRKPRVHITYDVEIGNAKRKRELPFVVGVMADLSGRPAEPLAPLSARDFDYVDGENFDAILAKAAPRLLFNVDDVLGDQGTVDVEVTFEKLADFNPDKVAANVAGNNEGLRKLLEERKHLTDLLNGMEGAPRFGNALQKILEDRAKRDQLRGEIGSESVTPGDE